jgi:hypothetical protein
VSGRIIVDHRLNTTSVHRDTIVRALCLLSILACSLYSFTLKTVQAAPFVQQGTLVLYDGGTGALPAAPLMGFTDFPPGAAMPTFSEGAALLDTTVAGNETYAGWVTNDAATPGFPILDRAAGFQVNFRLQVIEEAHTNPHRAGFSVIILADDAKGVELGFWQDEVWGQGDESTGGLFRHGEGTAFPTTEMTDYQVAIVGDTYILTANANPILTGPVRDYSTFDGFPDPYETSNFLFLGDGTTSAQAQVRLRLVFVTGTVLVTPTATTIITSTSSPVPSPLPMPSPTPVPSPTPATKAFEVCPPGLIALIMTISAVNMAKKFRRRL